MTNNTAKKAVLYRMVMPKHICPYGLKALHLLKSKGFEVEDHHLKSREETDAFKEKHNVKTTPQTFIDGQRVGGYTDLRVMFGMSNPEAEKDKTSYKPVLAVFAVTLLMGVAMAFAVNGTLNILPVLFLFVAFSMCVLAILKLQDLYSFTNRFLTYDLLAQKYPPYAYVYPFAEAFAGIGMISGLYPPLVGAVAMVIGGINGVSVIKAVYIEKRELKCACVGGGKNVPLGFLSLTENIMMFGMGLFMLVTFFL
ncbi:MAG: MauE/DoxX family redox-associated membrane protein [Pseudobdellovibrionaceae bacterium]